MAPDERERQRRYMDRLKARPAMEVCPHCGKPLVARPAESWRSISSSASC